MLLWITFAWLLGIGLLAASPQPNILWLTAEDLSPNLGCYGDAYATTPNLDHLAARSLLYRQAWSCAPVCAPARTTLIMGVHATATGAHHMRSHVGLPSTLKMFPQLLRDAGYYCVNNSKEDYNLEKPGRVWDESSRQAHWKKRAPGQPFFAVFNFEITHESQIRKRPHELVHDPARAPIPPYHPNTPEVRQDWAQYYDNITTMDGQIAERLRELEDAGLAGDTIVFFFGDHGSGMPRSKRWPYDSGLRVPFLIHIPAKWQSLAPRDYQPGGQTERLINFADLAPTMCSLAGVRPPRWMQGSAFLGPSARARQDFNHGYRGRMDERCDLVRSVTDGRFVYVRNYMPHLIYGQHLDFMFRTPTTRAWRKLHEEGRLTPVQDRFWEQKPPEELYDLSDDPHEIHNLAASPSHRGILTKLRSASRKQLLAIRDVGFLPEAEMHRLGRGKTLYELGHDDRKYPLKHILEMAELASSLEPRALPKLQRALVNAEHGGVRYWAALGILMRGPEAVISSRAELTRVLEDESPSVRIVAAQALGQFGTEAELARCGPLLLQLSDVSKNDYWVCLEALNAVEALGARAKPWRDDLLHLPEKAAVEKKLQEYVVRLLESIRAKL